MVCKSRKKGRYFEHLLFWRFAKSGWYVIRAPGSGAGSSHLFYPDFICIKKGKILVVELKARLDNRDLYIEKERYNKLLWIAGKTGGKALVCIYYKGLRDFRCLELENYDYTTNRYYVYKRSSFYKRGKKVEEVR